MNEPGNVKRARELTVLKIGGSAFDDATLLASVLDAIAALHGDVIVVHGGGIGVQRLAERLGVPQTMRDGRRVTDAETLDLAVMVYAGLLSKRLVAGMQARGRNAIGLSGADGNCLPATRRPAAGVDYGFVGDIDRQSVDIRFLASLLDAGMTPALCAIVHDGKGALLNTNADTIASVLASAFAAERNVHAVFCFDRPGVLRNVNDAGSVLPVLSQTEYQTLRAEGAISAGMLPKLDAAFSALHAGVARMHLMRASALMAYATGADTGGTDLVL